MLLERMRELADSRPPDFIIGGDTLCNAYMHRWWVIPRNPIFNIYLHHFLRSDDDRALHDHPWINLSIILEGEYTEHTIDAGGVCYAVVRKAGEFKFRGARSAHRIELHNGPCWTLFITGPKIRTWGFHCPKGWRRWQEFVHKTDKGSIGKGCD
jgi:hypothetical protein